MSVPTRPVHLSHSLSIMIVDVIAVSSSKLLLLAEDCVPETRVVYGNAMHRSPMMASQLEQGLVLSMGGSVAISAMRVRREIVFLMDRCGGSFMVKC